MKHVLNMEELSDAAFRYLVEKFPGVMEKGHRYEYSTVFITDHDRIRVEIEVLRKSE